MEYTLSLTGRLCFLLLLAYAMGSQLAHCRHVADSVQQLEITGLEQKRSQIFSLRTSQRIRVSAEAKSSLSLDVFVYDAVNDELVGRSDDEVVEPYYEWSAMVAGQYFVVIRNASSGSGTATISVAPMERFRSLPVIHKPNYAVMNVYYATDRGIATNSKEHATYGTEPVTNDQLQFGMARVSIPRSHLMGELEGPAIFRLEFHEDPEKHVVLLSAAPEDFQPFFESVAKRTALSAGREALVFVPGFTIGFEEATRRTAQIAYDLGFDGPAIVYSWPSQGKLGLIEYQKDVRNANLSVPHLQSFLAQLSEQSGAKTIHLIAHSMGNQVAVKALASLGEGALGKRVRIRHVALMAPDIDSVEFRRLAVAMKKAADDITLYASSRDSALKASQTLAGYPRAGASGKDLVVMPGVIDTIDCSSVDTSMLGLGHSYYADSTAILSDLFRLMHGDAPKARIRLRSMQSATGNYWVFAPAVH